MARNGISGWYVEVPVELKDEFKRLYGGRAAMKKLTIEAIKLAIRQHPSNIKQQELPLENR